MALTTLVSREGELRFESDSAKFQYLNDMLSMYQEHDKRIADTNSGNYELRFTTPENKTLYIGGSSLVAKSIIFNGIIQDLVCLRALLGLSKSNLPEAESFNERLLEYVTYLYDRGYIKTPDINAARVAPEKVKECKKQLEFNELSWPAEFMSKLERIFFTKLVPKIEKFTGEYDSSHIKEKIVIQVEGASN